MSTLRCIALLAVFTPIALADTNITGKWSGSFNITGPDGRTQDDTAYLVLRQNGSEVTGTVGPNEDQQFPIVKGKIESGKITLEADREGNSVKFDLVLADDRITGEANMSADGASVKAKLDVTRVK